MSNIYVSSRSKRIYQLGLAENISRESCTNSETSETKILHELQDSRTSSVSVVSDETDLEGKRIVESNVFLCDNKLQIYYKIGQLTDSLEVEVVWTENNLNKDDRPNKSLNEMTETSFEQEQLISSTNNTNLDQTLPDENTILSLNFDPNIDLDVALNSPGLLQIDPRHNDRFLEDSNIADACPSKTTSLNDNLNSSLLPNGINNNCVEPSVSTNVEDFQRKRKKKEFTASERKKLKLEKAKKSHTVQPSCNECKMKCMVKINEERRKTINECFWSMEDLEERRSFIFNQCDRHDVKRRTTNSEEFRRNKTVKYYFNDSNYQRQEVCKTFFLTTLGFNKKNDKFLNTILSTEKGAIVPRKSMRGKHPSVNKGPHQAIISHIETFNPEVPHYRREHAPLTRYLASDLNIMLMHGDFILKNPQFKSCVSYELYRRILKEQKISFARLGNEECETCENFNLHKHSKDNLDEDCAICNSWKLHDKLVKDSRTLYKEFAEKVSKTDQKTEVIFSADLEKIIMLPRLEMFKQIIFAPRLTTYNQTFAPVGKKSKLKPLAVLWHCAISGRNKEDIVSTFNVFFNHYRDTKRFILWLDNCSAQNKNWCLFTFFIKIVNSAAVAASEIEIYYFEPGHSFMSADSFHHQVELSLKAQKKTYDFDDFACAVGGANKGHVDVFKMSLDNFFIWKDWKSEAKMKAHPDRPYLKDMVHMKFARGKHTLQYKNTYEKSEDFKELDFLQPRILNKSIPEPAKLDTPKKFPVEKKN